MEFINPFNLPAGFYIKYKNKNLGSINEDQEIVTILTSSSLLVLQKIVPPIDGRENIPGHFVFQAEFPIRAATWIADVIENKLWKSEKEGGLPSDTYSYDEIIDNASLTVKRGMNIQNQGQKGFRISNYSLPNQSIPALSGVHFEATDVLLLGGGFLDVLKSIKI